MYSTIHNLLTDEEFQLMMDRADEKLRNPLSKEEARRSLQSAGILDENGELTEPYKCLELKDVQYFTK